MEHQFIDGTCGSKLCINVLSKLDCQDYYKTLNDFITINKDKYACFDDFKGALRSLAREQHILIHAKNDTLNAKIIADNHAFTTTPLSQNDALIVENLRNAVEDVNYRKAQKAAAKKLINLNAIKSIKRKKHVSADDVSEDEPAPPARRRQGRTAAQSASQSEQSTGQPDQSAGQPEQSAGQVGGHLPLMVTPSSAAGGSRLPNDLPTSMSPVRMIEPRADN